MGKHEGFSIEMIESKRREITELLEKEGISFAAIVGSVAKYGLSSHDIDIAVYHKGLPFSGTTYYELAERLQSLLSIEVDLIDLQFAPPSFILHALEGLSLICSDDIFIDLAENALREAEEEKYFWEEAQPFLFERIQKGLSQVERHVDRDRVTRYLAELDGAIGELRRLRAGLASFDDFFAHKDQRELCVHYLRIALEAVLDIARHIIAVKGYRLTSAAQSNLLIMLSELEVLPQEFTREIRGMQGMRNAIVHVYWNLDYQKIYEAITEKLSDFDRFAQCILEFLGREENRERKP